MLNTIHILQINVLFQAEKSTNDNGV